MPRSRRLLWPMLSACSGSGDGLCHTALDAVSRKYPGVMPGDVHSSQQREERTKKCRRGYRALSFGGWRPPRGLRNSLSSDRPRPHARGRLASSWPDKGGRKSLCIFSFLRIILCRASGPRIAVRGDGKSHTALRRGGSVIPHRDAESRNTRVVISHLSRFLARTSF